MGGLQAVGEIGRSEERGLLAEDSTFAHPIRSNDYSAVTPAKSAAPANASSQSSAESRSRPTTEPPVWASPRSATKSTAHATAHAAARTRTEVPGGVLLIGYIRVSGFGVVVASPETASRAGAFAHGSSFVFTRHVISPNCIGFFPDQLVQHPPPPRRRPRPRPRPLPRPG